MRKQQTAIKKQVFTTQILGVFFLLSSTCLAVSRFVPNQYSTIQAAINDCNDGDTVIISAGTYTDTGNRDLDFGGRAITVRSFDPKDPCIVAATIIDCQNSGRGFYFHTAETESSVVSGLTIINGSATKGGGIYCISGSPKITNCNFIGNRADYGGGIYNDESNPILNNCIFSGNSGTGYSGGGGGMYNDGSSPNLTNCEFSDNSATHDGAGIYQKYGNSILKNCIFLRNVSDDTGGGIFIETGSIDLTNCTFAENSATHGKAASLQGYWPTGWADINIINSILWDGGDEIHLDFFGIALVGYSDIQDCYGGTGNINADPCFVTGAQGDYYLSQVLAGQAGDSPCVNAGSDTALNLGMDVFTTRTDQVKDEGIVDMGHHYPAISGSPDIDGDLSVDLFDFSILANDWLLHNEPNDSNYLAGDITRDSYVDFKDILELSDAWLECLVQPARSPDPVDGATGTDTKVVLGWSAGDGALEHDVYLGTDANAVAQANRMSEEFMDTVSDVTFDPCSLDSGTIYFWRIDEAGPCTTKGYTWSFTTYFYPGKATNPVPADGTIIVNPETVVLRWTAGAFTTSHNIYLGTDFNDVNEANTLSPEFKGNQTTTSYEPCGLDANTTYYWRIDESDSCDTAKGDIWSFTSYKGSDFYYVINEGTLVEDFETIGDWTIGLGSGTIDSNFFKTGSGSLKITINAGAWAAATKTISSNGMSGRMGFWVYVEDSTKISYIYIYFSSQANFSKFFEYAIVGLNDGWNFISISPDNWTSHGGESWDNTMVRLRIRPKAVTGKVGVVYYDSLYYEIQIKPKCIISFDDGWADVYDTAYPYMENYGFKGTSFIVSSGIDHSGSMTLANLTTLYGSGWDISNHTYNHLDLTTLTETQQEAEVNTCALYLYNNGFTRNDMYKYFAYPYGAYDTNTLVALAAQGVTVARTATGGYNFRIKESTAPYFLKCIGVAKNTSLVTVESYIDNAIAGGKTVILGFHHIVTTPTFDTQWSTANFQALMDYLESKKSQIDVVTLSEWYSGPLTTTYHHLKVRKDFSTKE
jgi:peptidoglycan/xylan/chitin deacetylase (PgdA/CDA1 family)